VCDDEEASSALTHPTIPSRPEGLVGLRTSQFYTAPVWPLKLEQQGVVGRVQGRLRGRVAGGQQNSYYGQGPLSRLVAS
jgi:hypothetical protein